MQNIAKINNLIKQGKSGTQDLYSQIPFFLRTRLYEAISKQQWTSVSEGCQRNDQSSLEHARNMYKIVLQAADEYISASSRTSGTDNCILMMMDKNSIMNQFQDNPARFVLEMDKCLQRETELIFTYPELEQTGADNSEHNDDSSHQLEDGDIRNIENLMQEVCTHLRKARQRKEELDNFVVISSQLLQTAEQDRLVSEDSEMEIRHLLAEYENLNMQQNQATTELSFYKQSALNDINQLSLQCVSFAEKLTKDLDTWRNAEAKRSVKVGPKPNTASLLNKAKRFGAVINTAMEWFTNQGDLQIIREANEPTPADIEYYIEAGRLQMEFQNIQSSLIKIIVTVQPKGVVSIENKGKKEAPNYCTKKTQPFSSTVRVLGAESFPTFLIISKNVELVAEKDLAQGSLKAVTGKDGLPCLRVDASNGNTLPDIQFNIEVKNFHRVEQNNVYKQFFRLVYTVKVSVNGCEYNLQTMSLPFTFNTGANQILEHMGARMWYCASVDDLYNSGYQCPDPLSADDIIKMLENRIAYIGNKTRRLTDQEKAFLRTRLPVASDDTVTMQGFLKDKMKTLRDEELLNFPFYTWFYAVVHSIEELLLDAWQDGIIYGFCSEKTAEELLMNPNVPEGSFLLRPSVSVIKKTSSAEATAATVMEVKLRKMDAQPFDSHEFTIFSVPLFHKHIQKNTLYGAIKGIECNRKPIAKFLYDRNGRGRELSILKGYVKKKEDTYYPEYRLLMENIEKISIRLCPKQPKEHEEVSDSDDDTGREPNKRKRRYRKSQSTSQSPSMSATKSDSPSGLASLPVFCTLSSTEIKQENSPPQFQSSSTAHEQCQRSGTQDKSRAGTSDGDTINGNTEQDSGFYEHAAVFGDLRVDVSNIVNATGLISSYDQNGFPELNSCDFTEISVAPVQYATQYPGNRVSNCGFMDSVYSLAGSSVLINSSVDNDAIMQEASPASVKSSCSEIAPSPSGGNQMSPLNVNMQSAANLPTILNEAKEPKRRTRQERNPRANTRNNNNSSIKRGPTSSMAAVTLNMENASSSSLHLMNLNNPCNMDTESLGLIFTVDNSVGTSPQHTTTYVDNLDDTLLLQNMLKQKASLQFSPDSGVGDQTPSPESVWKSHPFSAVFQSRSDIEITSYPSDA